MFIFTCAAVGAGFGVASLWNFKLVPVDVFYINISAYHRSMEIYHIASRGFDE